MARCWVYLLRCSDSTLYAGATKDLRRRVAEHNAGRGSRYTRSRVPVSLAYAEPVPAWGLALRREVEIKKMSRAEKLRLCRAYALSKQSSR